MNGYKTLVVASLGVLASGVASAHPLPNAAEHTVEWYSSHAAARRQVNRECMNDRTYENYPDCRNAVAAETGAEAPAQPATDDMTQPGYYVDKRQRDIVLALCGVNHPPPAAVCSAARNAASAANKKGSGRQ
ncbi:MULTISPECIES: EexN family lipoprotein [Acetobacteraceae]|uniref:EexN family lipoprotein n=1 Tax=Acetobacteraceae TaxID=433 RepID=UPI000793BA27|nr:EexN family lipoprotein [Novacetimonas hansenii]WEQ60531.1 EexN family lipoprotein [Novacetimonas hansenii]WEQ60584.1 EexN family lipoprotein [Novacetimonas hansenii]CUW48764.1 hypothetical protein ATCC53582_02911 [Novacetimonas hansenii]